MKRHGITLLSLGLTVLFLSGFAKKNTADPVNAPKVGNVAPAFTGMLHTGKPVSLADHKGKYVVLEWLNHGCPYVRKHYDSGNMQKVQAKAKKAGAMWYSVVSSAEGKQGYLTARQALKSIQKEGAKVDGIILDPKGEIGRAYMATATPHMVIIDPAGKIAYFGAIDSMPTVEKDDIKKAKNFVLAAFANFAKNKPADPARTEAYGCGIKYSN